MDDVDAVVHIERHRVERIAIGLARIHHRRRLVKHIRLEILIRERGSTHRSNAQRSQPELGEKLTPAEIVS
jgi:hypothetical protein